MNAPRRIVVVGAGLAGLAAAFHCARRGDRVTLLERAAQPGGRAARRDGDPDPTALRVTTADRDLLGLIRAAGLAREHLPVRPVASARVQAGGLIAVPAGVDPRSVSHAPGVGRLEALRLLRLPRLLARYRDHLDAGAPERAAPLDDRSLADFGTLYFGRGVVDGWMEPWLAERAPVDPDETSRAAFLLRWWREGEAVAGTLAAPVSQLAETLARRLGVRTDCAVRAIEPDGRAGLRVVLDAEVLAADAVVLAVPAPEAARVAAPVLVAAERSVLAGVGYDAALVWRGAARIEAGSRPARIRPGPRGATPFASLAVDGGTVTAIVREPVASARRDAPDDVLAKELAAQVDRLLPRVVASEGVVHRYPLAWPRFDVGRLRALARFRAVEADRRAAGRRLSFAGDWLVAPTLEGAVASATAAAPR